MNLTSIFPFVGVRATHGRLRGRLSAPMLVVTLLLGGCGTDGDKSEGVAPPAAAEPPPLPVEESAPAFDISPVDAGGALGVAAEALHGDLQAVAGDVGSRRAGMTALYRSNAEEVEIYHGTLAAIEARLHLGTVAANPVLVEQWNEAQTALDQIAWNLTRLNGLVDELDGDATTLRSIRQNVQDLQRQTAAEAGDQVTLALLRDDATQGLRTTQGLRAVALEEMGRHGALLVLQRGKMTGLRAAIEAGDLTAATGTPGPGGADPAAAEVASLAVNGLAPRAVVKFDRPNVTYERPLTDLVTAALDADPGAEFTLLAVAPARTDPIDQQQAAAAAQQYAQAVRRTLTRLGVAPDQVNLGFATRRDAQHSEVHVFIE